MRWFALKKTPANTDYLSSLRIAAPCKASWDSMEGDNRVRLCGQCDKNVYHISQMTRDEANEFLRLTAYGACVQFYQRSDGTIITDNCPVGLRKLRGQYKRAAAAVATMISFAQGLFLAGIAADSAKDDSSTKPPTALGGEPTVIRPSHIRGKLLPPTYVPHCTPMQGGAPIAIEAPVITSYKAKVESSLIAAMPKNVELGNAALALQIGTDGSIATVNLIAKSPNKTIDDLILESIRKLKFDEVPSGYVLPEGLPIYFECRKAAR